MDKLSDLKDLLRHEIEDLYSAELQITDALPHMIVKAVNEQLKDALEEHLHVTQMHRVRLDKILQLLQAPDPQTQQVRAFLSKLFGGSGTHKCIGTEGLIKEGQQVMKEQMDPQVMDAAIIACAQKIEHYEICGYGTARAYAKALQLTEIGQLLGDTLAEEYAADDLLTQLAMQDGVNQRAEKGEKVPAGTTGKTTKVREAAAKKKPAAKKAAAKKAIPKKTTPKK